MKNKPIVWAFILLLIGIASAQNTYVLLSEDFESLPLGTSVEEAAGTPNVWTDTPPDGWFVDESGVPGIGDPATDGMTEWAGWAFTNKDWWIQVAEDQRRTEFTLGEGTVAVADPDEWDDSSHPGPNSENPFKTWLSTPPVDLSTARPGTLQLTFDSSWRPEYDDDYHQTANLTVSFDGADPIELFRWESNSASPNFKDDNSTNETIVVDIDNPSGATSMVLTFGLFDAGNDWWWAIDNIVVTGDRLAERAFDPHPANAEEGLPAKTVLSWTSGEYVHGLSPKHKVLLSDDPDAVKDGSAVVSTQDANSFDATGLLDFSTAYYWRIDEANSVSGWDEGSVWTFTVEPRSFAVPIGAVSATATSMSEGQSPANLVDGSGLNPDDGHSNLQEFMWLSEAADLNPAVTFTFARREKLDKVHVWNHNTQTESILGFGFKDVLIESSVDGTTWTEVATMELAQATGLATYTGAEIPLGGVVARSIRMTCLSNYSILGLPQKGLSEVRFYALPMSASQERPADGMTNMEPLVDLSWRAGREAVTHEVLVGTDPAALDRVATVDDPAYTLAAAMNSTVYWQIHEVNDAADPALWEGDLWSFTTAAYATVDDMDDYRSEDGLWVWETWRDGFGDDNNGALLGYSGDDMELDVKYDGRQSLPYAYGQGGAGHSEAVRDINRDWSQHGIVSLSLMFHGKSSNTAGQMYIKVNGTVIATYPTSSDLTVPQWFAWTLDLPASALGNVDTLAIGVNGGTGLILVDAIRLYDRASELVHPVVPDDTGLMAYYPFEGNASDASGHGHNGTPEGGPQFVTGHIGQALDFDGVDDFVSTGKVASQLDIDGNKPRTVSAWVYTRGFADGGIYDVGARVASEDFSLRTLGDVADQWRVQYWGGDFDFTFNTLERWVHFVHVHDGTHTVVYGDGQVLVNREKTLNTTDTNPFQIGLYGWPGNFFYGIIDEVRVYNRALTQAEALGLAGRTDPIFKEF
jgi:hypothetical protein